MPVLTRANTSVASRASTRPQIRWVSSRGEAPGADGASGVHAAFPVTQAPLGNSLTYFTVTGYWYDVEQPDPDGTSIQPMLLDVNAFVDFIPRLPEGFAVMVNNLIHGDGTQGDTYVPLAPITGRLINGRLSAIAIGDPVGVGLLANSAPLNLAVQLQQLNWDTTALIYDVRFRNVTYGGAPQVLTNFAFYAPPAATTISLTSAALTRLPYAGP